MSESDLPDDVKRLIREHIFSVEQLEILLLFKAKSDSELDARSVSLELRNNEGSTAARLLDLEKRGFLSSRQDRSRIVYRYTPNSEWLRQTVELLEASYAGRRYTVMEIIFSKPIDHLRVFAGAFRFKKDDSDG